MNVVGLQVEPSKRVYACTFDGCSSVFDRPYRLAQHRLVHANVKPFICEEPKCEKAYSSKSHLDRHVKTAHKETEENLLYCCPKCMKKYVNRQNLKRHIKVSHIDNNKPFCCDTCRTYFKKVHQLRAHMYVHNGVKPFRCPMCDRDFVTLYEKKKHMRNHKVYKCEHCEMKFTRWTELMQHKRVDHVSPEYICHDCGKVFKERGHIIRHVKKHMPNTPVTVFFCPYDNCLRHYSRNSNLKQHILVKHEGLTFDCSLCGAKLSTKAKLNEHVDRHNRPDLPVKVHKTLKTGRKKRKDAGTIRYETAMRLAGIVKQKIEDGISRHYTENVDYQENIEDDNSHSEHSYQNGDLKNKFQEHYNELQKNIDLPEEKKCKPTEQNLSIELKVEASYSNDSVNYQDEVENSTSEAPRTAQHINEDSMSSQTNERVNFRGKPTINKPVNLIEILNRPSIQIGNHEKTESKTSQLSRSISIEVKIEPDTNNHSNDFDYELDIELPNVPNDNKNNQEQVATSNQPISTIPIKVEHNIEDQSNITDYVDYPVNIRKDALCAQNMPLDPTNNDISPSSLQLYWRKIFNRQDV